MRASDFKETCQILWGRGDSWAAEAAAFLKVGERNVYYWAAGRKVIPPGVAQELGAEMHRRLLDPSDQTPGLAVMREAHQRLNAGTAAE
jgi:hypothetical protein